MLSSYTIIVLLYTRRSSAKHGTTRRGRTDGRTTFRFGRARVKRMVLLYGLIQWRDYGDVAEVILGDWNPPTPWALSTWFTFLVHKSKWIVMKSYNPYVRCGAVLVTADIWNIFESVFKLINTEEWREHGGSCRQQVVARKRFRFLTVHHIV